MATEHRLVWDPLPRPRYTGSTTSPKGDMQCQGSRMDERDPILAGTECWQRAQGARARLTDQVQEEAAGSGHCKGISTSSAAKESYFKALQVFSLLNQQFLHPGQTTGLVLKSIPLPLTHGSGRALEHRASARGRSPGAKHSRAQGFQVRALPAQPGLSAAPRQPLPEGQQEAGS